MDSTHFASWLHIGDLHASDEDGWASVATLARIVDDVQRHIPKGALDFAFLPGDVANHGERDQYRRVAEALRPLDLPVHAIPGDHDFEPGSLAAFDATFDRTGLPKSVCVGGRRALFIDIVSAGAGGPDFRLGAGQTAWLARELAEANRLGEPRPLVFMHAFPADLHEGGREIARLFANAHVAFVDTGHTHYNEILNDGAVVYAATRSTGQIEEGPAGFAIAAVDGDSASWRFKALDTPWPWVMITSPADERMAVADAAIEVRPAIRALVLGNDATSVMAWIDDAQAVPMHRVAGRASLWSTDLVRPLQPGAVVRVTAMRSDGTTTTDEIRFVRSAGARSRDVLGTHDNAIGAWPEHDVLGTRLGPNAKGKKW